MSLQVAVVPFMAHGDYAVLALETFAPTTATTPTTRADKAVGHPV